jgi:hypothetical protein
MAFRYLIYSTGTTYATTIVRESATNNPGINEASLYSDFVIPEIQPLYLWRVTGGTTVVPNTDSNVNLYEAATAPPPSPNDAITYGEVTGITNTKIDKIYAVAGNFPVISVSGNLIDSGLDVADIIVMGSGVTKSEFVSYTAATATEIGLKTTQSNLAVYTGNTATAINLKTTQSNLAVYTGNTATAINLKTTQSNLAVYTGATATAIGLKTTQSNLAVYTGATATAINLKAAQTSLSTYTGTTAPATFATLSSIATYTGATATAINSKTTQANLATYTGATATLIGSKVAKVTGATTGNIVTFAVGGEVQDSAKTFTTVVNTAGLATNAFIPTELAVRSAINQAVAAAVILQGDWDATTNSPDLTVTGITTGFAWRVSVSGTTSLGGLNVWYVGDLAVKSASGWIRIASQDIAAIWGNISGTLSNQTDLQNALNAKASAASIATYTGATATLINTKASQASLSTYTGATATLINTKASQSNLAVYTGATATEIGLKTTQSNLAVYTGATATLINSKASQASVAAYTGATANLNKKIQLVSNATTNVNTITPTPIVWATVPYSANTYMWSGGSAVYIKSAGNYEVQYHVTLRNSTSNQTHSIGAYLIKNNLTTIATTATAGMIVGASAGGELSLPPVVETFALNDRLDLAAFRIGSTGTVNLVNGSVYLMLNKLS